MIFISHNHKDKPIVEPVALQLREIFGQDRVFYDSWSIQPGDGIIEKMSEALGEAEFFFFFVSENSISSKMVSLEWQNALLKASHGNCKLVPVRLDSVAMPPILSQTLYIDLYSVGLDAAVAQMANVVQGLNGFQRANQQPYSNLGFTVSGDENELNINILAQHYLEPITSFVILVMNDEGELVFKTPNEDPTKTGFNKGIKLNNGHTYNGQLVGVFRGLTPQMPIHVNVKAVDGCAIKFCGVLHQKTPQNWAMIPQFVG